jgi:hypothetical protein
VPETSQNWQKIDQASKGSEVGQNKSDSKTCESGEPSFKGLYIEGKVLSWRDRYPWWTGKNLGVIFI